MFVTRIRNTDERHARFVLDHNDARSGGLHAAHTAEAKCPRNVIRTRSADQKEVSIG